MKGASKGAAVIAVLAGGCAAFFLGCAYGGEADPGGARIDGSAGASGSKGGEGGGSGTSVTSGTGGSGGVPVDPTGSGGNMVAPEEAGAPDASDEPVAMPAADTGVVDTGPRDTGVVVPDVVKPPLLFDPSKLYFIKLRNGNGTLAMDVEMNNQANGTHVIQWTFTATDDAMQWWILDNGNNTWRIAMKSNKNVCVDNPANMTANGTKMQMWACMNNDVWQQWDIQKDASGADTYQLKNLGSGRYLDEPGSAVTVGLQLQVYDQNMTPAQKFVITPTN